MPSGCCSRSTSCRSAPTTCPSTRWPRVACPPPTALPQSTLAADLLSADLADLTDPWQPALLTLVAMTAEAGRRTGKPVGVCGEAAAAPLPPRGPLGLGITSLSCAASAVAGVGARLATVDLETCRLAAEVALAQADPGAARAGGGGGVAGD